AAVEAGYPNLAVILAVTTLISYWYYLRVIVTMYMREPRRAMEPIEWGRPLRAALVVCALVTVLMGVLPSWPLLKAEQSV
ncbi:MAG: NADH-quinone oxidoreductase subunit N, partial [Gemmatimonadetes bacterium]|nr:NADH-quinone oxidoreductase subunit N [Gemmatimonadota bacterium]NIS02565.1 NADH-quinone oxidoreductase subunit N [Gemmatimonadota bacterium]NIT68441.1 NADH-quinone oxidoreductase subunit N [Gemmatimonadota bacterium]NIU51893.1 NADH-quinone oxidoreductase subunit N [Gemmatimonadota bacterium]NIV24996.1 NADH-quinone oxidoreductase subunit N [Gemmatimonadota bacterium]